MTKAQQIEQQIEEDWRTVSKNFGREWESNKTISMEDVAKEMWRACRERWKTQVPSERSESDD